MKRSNTCSVLLTCLVLAGAGVSGCHSDKHTMVEPKDGAVIVCKECYQEITKARNTLPRSAIMSTSNVSTHFCPYCKTEMSIYSENGVLKVKCAKCAPEGLACDKCLPPKDYVPPAAK